MTTKLFDTGIVGTTQSEALDFFASVLQSSTEYSIIGGALLHDIGKIIVPDNILFKRRPLDDKKWERMRMHPEYAWQMLAPIPFLARHWWTYGTYFGPTRPYRDALPQREARRHSREQSAKYFDPEALGIFVTLDW